MTSNANDIHAFACPSCSKRLKAPSKASGKKTKCPKCGKPLTVPSFAPAVDSQPIAPLSLNTPAIADLDNRQDSANDIKAKKAKLRKAVRNRAYTEKEVPGELEPVQRATTNGDGGKQPDVKPDKQSAAERSVFDDDLPELEDLDGDPEPSPPNEVQAAALRQVVDMGTGLGDLDDLVPDLNDATTDQQEIQEDEFDPDAEYRIVCKTCGTAQHVSPSVEGMKIKCPDCFVQFKVPPPPKGWKPTKQKSPQVALEKTDMPLAPPDQLPHAQSDEMRRVRTQEMLEKAELEVVENKLDRLYDSDFDTSGFFQRTFGFFHDFVTMTQVVAYGIVAAGAFALIQFGANDTASFFGKGLTLLTFVLVPLIGMLFALPMLSGGLALIEAVANKQSAVREFPAFNMFDNGGDLLLIAVSVAASIVPGFFLGGWLSDGIYLRILGMMLTCFALFPLFLLSMLDNGSLFQPFSSSVIKSLKSASEAWAGYYLKTMVAFFLVLMLWFVLLGRSPLMAACGGLLLPLLFFFICQQVGSLANAIADHLSFEFTPSQREDDVDEDPTPSMDT